MTAHAFPTRTVKDVAFYSLEVGAFAWLISGSQGEYARQAFARLMVLRPTDPAEDYANTAESVTLNLIAWDRHPSQDNAHGMIIDQHVWIRNED